jgi:glutamate decarboxylase
VNTHDFNTELYACIIFEQVAPRIKERMMKEGSMMVTYQPLRNQPNFFRLVLQNSGVVSADMDYFVQEFERLGSDL